jgi:isopentenyl-diphosphate Delta-isomerase
MEYVILVDKDDKETGRMEKMEAHRKGLLHRAFSILIYNSNGEMLIQKRADNKYHSPGLWTNTCCSHPRPGEATAAAAQRRLMEEMGIDVPLQFSHTFMYAINFENNLSECELDHVFTGVFDGKPTYNPLEVSDWKFVSTNELRISMDKAPAIFTHWFKIIIDGIYPQ